MRFFSFPFAYQEHELQKMRVKVRELESKNEVLKELCRIRQQEILRLQEKLKIQCRPLDIGKDERSDHIEVQGAGKLSSCAESSRQSEQVQHSSSVHTEAGNKENFLHRHGAIQKPRREVYNKNYNSTARR
jgi:hypothetical protein